MQRSGVLFQMENENRHARHAHTYSLQKRDSSVQRWLFSTWEQFGFGNFLSLVWYYCQDPTNMEVSCHTGSWIYIFPLPGNGKGNKTSQFHTVTLE